MEKTYTHEKVIVIKWEIHRVHRWFMKYEFLKRARKDMPKCQMCDYKFEKEDMVAVAFVRKELNKVICQECAEKAISGGAEEI